MMSATQRGVITNRTSGRGREPSSLSKRSKRVRKPSHNPQKNIGDISTANRTGPSKEDYIFKGPSHDDSAETVTEETNTPDPAQVNGQVTPSTPEAKSPNAESVTTDTTGAEDKGPYSDVIKEDTDDISHEDMLFSSRPESVMTDWETYTDVIDPEHFDSRSFLSNITELSLTLQSDNYQNIDSDFPADELRNMVSAVRVTFNNFTNYTNYCQGQMEDIRFQMKDIKDRMHRRIQNKPYDPNTANDRMGLDERHLEAKRAALNSDLARAAEELARASAVSLESETASVEACISAERATQEANRIQEEYEARRSAECEQRRLVEERRVQEVERLEEERRKREAAKRAEEARRAKLRLGANGNRPPVWENWPHYVYRTKSADVGRGLGCIVRADPSRVKESWIQCDVIDQLNSNFRYEENEELVSNIIDLRPSIEDELLQASIFVAIPHCITRPSAIHREPIVKAEMNGCWVELRSQEVMFDDKKELKFVQAEVKTFTKLAVVSRFKRDFLHVPKRGGKITSNVDSRVTFTVQRGTFPKTEHFVLQLQAVDSGSVTDIKTRREGAGLLTASSIVNTEWTSSVFKQPLTMTLPCPPNPVKARKAAALRAAKEAKMKKPMPTPLQMLEEAKRKMREEEQRQEKPIPVRNRWYMGQYSVNDEDENDLLYVVAKRSNGRWVVVDDVKVTQARLDLLQFDLPRPIERFIAIRTRTSVEAKQAQNLAEVIERQLTQRTVTTIIKQRSADVTDVILHVTPVSRAENLLKSLAEDGFDEGPGPSPNILLKEGDGLEVTFRGNIQCCDEATSLLSMVYNSNLSTSVGFDVREVDRFLQKNYSVFRGFVQVFRRTETVRYPCQGEQEHTEPWVEVSRELMSEHLVNIPKELASTPTPKFVKKAPFAIKNYNDPVTEETLQDLAAELGDEWQKMAQLLNIKRMRIQAILRNHAGMEDEEAKQEMLLSWAKRVPRGVQKVPVLCQALVRCGRDDLAGRLSDLERDFKENRIKQDQEL